jgi:hypothetical protein
MSEGNVPRGEDTEGNVPRREDTDTMQQRCPQQCVVLVFGAFLLGFSSAFVAVALGKKLCPRC